MRLRRRRRPQDPHGTIHGHPAVPLFNDHGDTISMITVCAECGEMRTIIMLTGDRWYCSKCRASGANNPKLYPVS